MELAEIWRHPVKSLGAEALDTVDLTRGRPVPWDRVWAVAHGGAGPVTGWAEAGTFVTQTYVPRLAQIGTRFDPATHLLQLTHPDRPDLAIRPGTPDGDDALSEWLEPLTEGTARSGPFLVHQRHDGAFTDFEEMHISLASVASRRALSDLAGVDLAPIRFRMNLWLDGLAPWEEHDWVGREIAIGPVRLRILERDERCNATAASPVTGTRDVSVPQLLRQQLGHMDFGLYAQVTEGGTVRCGDDARLL